MTNIDIERELKKLERRFDSIEKNIELLLKDRNILEDIELKVDNLNNTVLSNRDKQQEVQKNLTADIKDVQNAVEDKVNEVKDIVGNTEIIMVKKDKLEGVKRFLHIK